MELTSIKTYLQKRSRLDVEQSIVNRLEQKYENINEFILKIQSFNQDLELNKDAYNINPYLDKIKQGIYILGKHDTELEVFPHPNLALKCSQGKFGTENLRKQFVRSMQLAIEFESKLDSEQNALLNICPVYLHFQTSNPKALFKQILFMKKIAGGISLGNTQTGFSERFCQAFKIPSLEQIQRKSQFGLHLSLDRDRQRQLLKIQTVYLFRRLWFKGIRILSLNQRNILVSQDNRVDRYTIIDPIMDLSISPIYNLLTYPFCY